MQLLKSIVGFFKRIFGFKKVEESFTIDFDINNPEDRKIFIHDTCKEIKESLEEIERIKHEYQIVTQELSDIQKIEQLPKNIREKINDYAENIVKLRTERNKYQSALSSMGDVQFKHIEPYVKDMPNIIKNIKELEDRQSVIKNDLHHLEGEKGALSYQKTRAIELQAKFKKYSIVFVILFSLLFIVLTLMNFTYNLDVLIPSIVVSIAASVYVVILFYYRRKIIYDIKLVDMKQKRAIELLNKVKIKYVNNTNHLEYEYSKYRVNSYNELNYIWEQYNKYQSEKKIYKQATGELVFFEEQLSKQLSGFDLVNSGVWVHQAEALINNKEMVEIKHRLNSSRQQLRGQLDYNQETYDGGVRKLRILMGQSSGIEREVRVYLNKNKISID